MDQGATDTIPERAPVVPSAVPAPASARRRPRLGVDLTLLAIVGVLLIGAVGAGLATLYKQFYSPSAFVEHYLGLLADGRAADALALPGVAADSADLAAAGFPGGASDALLRQAALAPLSDIRAVAERAVGDATRVTVSYTAGRTAGTSTFDVERDGWIGLVPAWRFAASPLAVLDVAVRGSMRFSVNGFEIDKRQVSADGEDAKPLAAVPLLVFTPGLYQVSVDTAVSATPGTRVLADAPRKAVELELQAEPTKEFVDVVQQRVEEFLTACTDQQVLQPTACPFGYFVDDRIDGLPVWSIVTQPAVKVLPDGADWKIPAAHAVARIEVDVQSLFDGSVRHVREDVPFTVTGRITVLPDGTASIQVGG